MLRWRSASPLWLDEAQCVAIARLPIAQLVSTLRQDGSPPLYYLMLHFWMHIFGSGATSARSLSGVISVATLAPMWCIGRRLGGSKVAWISVLLLASSPFAVRYGSEARMYALVMLLSLLLLITAWRCAQAPTSNRIALVAIVTTAMLLTHYWTLFLVAAVAVVAMTAPGLAARSRRAVVVAISVGAVLAAPAAPLLIWQMAHTATPWSARPGLPAMLTAASAFAAGLGGLRWLLCLCLVGAAALALRSGRRRDLAVDPAAMVARVAGLATVFAFTAGVVSSTALAPRYMSIIVPSTLLAAGASLGRHRRQVLAAVSVGGMVTIGLVASLIDTTSMRTQAGQVAAALNPAAKPGDVVVYCPDQLGPDVSRLLHPATIQLTYPRRAAPQIVDWTDYAAIIKSTPTRPFAETIAATAGPGHDIWLVWAPAHRGLEQRCQELGLDLAALRGAPTNVLEPSRRYHEQAGVSRYPATAGDPLRHE